MWAITFARFVVLVSALELANAATGAAQPASPAPEPALCPVGVEAETLAGHDDTTVFHLMSDGDSGAATGTIAAYAGTQRYRIPFARAVAGDRRNASVIPTPIVIRFPAPTHVESAYVESLDGGPCTIHDVYLSQTLFGKRDVPQSGGGLLDIDRWLAQFRAQAAKQTPEPAPQPDTVAAPACARPYAPASAKTVAQPSLPLGVQGRSGDVIVNVALGADGTVLGTRVLASSLGSAWQEQAVRAAQHSTFAAPVYRCAPVSGSYDLVVDFEGFGL
jgi:TonB family protein